MKPISQFINQLGLLLLGCFLSLAALAHGDHSHGFDLAHAAEHSLWLTAVFFMAAYFMRYSARKKKQRK